MVYHAQALQIVLKASGLGHAGVQGILPRVPEGRVSQVMGQRNGFHQVLVELQRSGHRSPQLGYF